MDVTEYMPMDSPMSDSEGDRPRLRPLPPSSPPPSRSSHTQRAFSSKIQAVYDYDFDIFPEWLHLDLPSLFRTPQTFYDGLNTEFYKRRQDTMLETFHQMHGTDVPFPTPLPVRPYLEAGLLEAMDAGHPPITTFRPRFGHITDDWTPIQYSSVLQQILTRNHKFPIAFYYGLPKDSLYAWTFDLYYQDNQEPCIPAVKRKYWQTPEGAVRVIQEILTTHDAQHLHNALHFDLPPRPRALYAQLRYSPLPPQWEHGQVDVGGDVHGGQELMSNYIPNSSVRHGTEDLMTQSRQLAVQLSYISLDYPWFRTISVYHHPKGNKAQRANVHWAALLYQVYTCIYDQHPTRRNFLPRDLISFDAATNNYVYRDNHAVWLYTHQDMAHAQQALYSAIGSATTRIPQSPNSALSPSTGTQGPYSAAQQAVAASSMSAHPYSEEVPPVGIMQSTPLLDTVPMTPPAAPADAPRSPRSRSPTPTPGAGSTGPGAEGGQPTLP